jgi:hypothetical protein
MSTNTSDIVTNIGTLSDSFIEIALDRYIDNVIGADVFRSTEIDSFADYAVYMWDIIVQFRAMKFLMDSVPAITRNDSSAGAPLTRATHNGMIASILGLPVPLISLHLADLVTTPIELYPPNPVFGYPTQYFFPIKPHYQAATFETNLGLAAAEYDGLAGSNQLGKLTIPLTTDLLQYRRPLPLQSSLGRLIQAYLPAQDDAAAAVEVRDNTFDLIFDKYIIPDWHYDYVGFFCIGATAGWDMLVNTAGAAGKVNCQYATVGSSSLTDVSDFASSSTVNSMARWMLNQDALAGSSLFYLGDVTPFVTKDNVFSVGESQLTRRMIQAAGRDCGRPYSTPAGLITRMKQSDNAIMAAARGEADKTIAAYQHLEDVQNSSTAADNWNKSRPKSGHQGF